MRQHSIRGRIIWFFSLAMIAAAGGTFMLILMVSSTVMQRTLRSYLISAVEASADDLSFHKNGEEDGIEEQYPHDIFLQYRDGLLRIDEDFLDTMHDVESALCDESGTVLYGKNPFAREERKPVFDGTRVYRMEADGAPVFVYDRKLDVDGTDGLWIRGVVPLTQETEQIRDISVASVFFLPLMILFAGVFGYMAAHGILRPLREMEQSAAEITSGTDLKKRLELGKTHDEVYELGQTMNAMLERLDTSFEAERRFASDASHELRTPVSVIMARTELTLERPRSGAEYREALEVIRRQGGRMQTLIGDMLDYTRMEQRIDRYPMSMVDLSALVRDTCEDMRLIAYRDISLIWHVEEGIVISGNAGLLTRLLQNLIDNAYRYGKEHGRTVVSLAALKTRKANPLAGPAGRAAGTAVLSVADDGIGISKEDLPHVFERFYRGDKSRSVVKGNGLGLSMVGKIAEIHGAEAEAESEEGEGSTFTVRFPIPPDGKSFAAGPPARGSSSGTVM